MRGDKRRVAEFGKRGLEQVEHTERKPTAMERLKKAGIRWWGVGGTRKTARSRGKGFRRVRL